MDGVLAFETCSNHRWIKFQPVFEKIHFFVFNVHDERFSLIFVNILFSISVLRFRRTHGVLKCWCEGVDNEQTRWHSRKHGSFLDYCCLSYWLCIQWIFTLYHIWMPIKMVSVTWTIRKQPHQNPDTFINWRNVLVL